MPPVNSRERRTRTQFGQRVAHRASGPIIEESEGSESVCWTLWTASLRVRAQIRTVPGPRAGQLERRPVRRRVLIVDDDPATRLGLCELLEHAGYDCVAVDSFEIARSLLRTAPPDVLITDVRLGDYNGLQLLIQSSVPAIVISGFPDPVLRSDAEHFGASYLAKPINPSVVLEILSQKAAVH